MTQTFNAVREWIKKVDRVRNSIKKEKPKDRLGYVKAIEMCVLALNGSCQGWASWISEPKVMERFSEEELKKMFDVVRKVTLVLLEHDVYWTKNLLSKFEKEAKKKKKTDQTTYIQDIIKKKRKQDTYVS